MDQEEGFNLAIRRMLRSSGTHYVLHIAYSLFGFIRNNRDLLQLLQNSTVDQTQPLGGILFQMRGGDQFVVLNEAAAARVPILADNITANAFPDRTIDEREDQPLVRIFQIPHDYMELRRAVNVYLEASSGGAAVAATPEVKPLKDDLDGPLTPWSLGRIESALADMDVTSYLRTQAVYQTNHQGQWRPLFEEHFISIGDLNKERFPKVVLHADDRLFVELCRVLDRRSVPEILRRHRGKPGQRRSLNLSLGYFHSAFFEKFMKESGEFERKTLILEVNRSDLLHHPRETVKALAGMREAGFGIALDGIPLDLLAFTNLHKVDFDYIKIVLSPAKMWMLKDGDCVGALKRLPREKIVLCQCEKNSALPVGQAFGLDKFQGWAIDQLAATATAAATAAAPGDGRGNPGTTGR